MWVPKKKWQQLEKRVANIEAQLFKVSYPEKSVCVINTQIADNIADAIQQEITKTAYEATRDIHEED